MSLLQNGTAKDEVKIHRQNNIFKEKKVVKKSRPQKAEKRINSCFLL